MISVTRKRVRMPLAVRAAAVKQIAPANPFGTKESPLEVERRKLVKMRVMEGMKRKPVSMSFGRPLTPCALTGLHLCRPLTANSSGGREKSMTWNQRQRLGSRSNGHIHPSSLTRRIILDLPQQ